MSGVLSVSVPRLPSPIIQSRRSSVSLDGAGAVSTITDAARARATLARIRDMVNSSLEAFGGVDGDADASTKMGIDDSGSSYEALKSLYALDSPPRQQRQSHAERPAALAPLAPVVAVVASHDPLYSKDRPRPRSIDAPLQASNAISDETAPLAALREGIERALALLPSSVDIMRSCSVNGGGVSGAGSAWESQTRMNVPVALGDGRLETEGVLGPRSERVARRHIEGANAGTIASSVRCEQMAAASGGSSVDMSRTSSLAAPSQLLAVDASFRHERDADISRLEDRIELLFAQVRDAERRACAAAADAQEALRLGSSRASPRSSPQRAHLDRPSPSRQSPPSPQATSSAIDRCRNATVGNDILHTTGGAGAAAAPVHAPVVAPSRPDEINMYLETDMAHTCSADWLAGGPSPRSARAAAQRAADARRSTIHSRPQKSDQQCDRPSAPTVRRPWRGVRHGSWDPSKWSREVDSVGGRGLESAVAAAPLLRKKK
jgi:hypothetical protein